MDKVKFGTGLEYTFFKKHTVGLFLEYNLEVEGENDEDRLFLGLNYAFKF